MTTVACVLRSGGRVYDATWVTRLAAGVRLYDPAARVVCLTDVTDPIAGVDETVPLHFFWPGWWSKAELFRPGALPEGELVVYLDLDTLPVGSIADLADWDGDLALLSDFYRPRSPATGVILFRPGARTAAAFRRFMLEDPRRVMQRHTGRSDYWWATALPDADRIQELFPGQVVSLKAHARKGPPAGARLVCGHGDPRFSDPAAGWAHAEWVLRSPERSLETTTEPGAGVGAPGKPSAPPSASEREP